MSSTRVEDCVEDALADLERQGRLHLADVQRLIDLHRLDGAETSEVLAVLRQNGLKLDEDAPAPAQIEREPSEVNKATWDTLGLMLRAAGRVKLLTAEEEVLLGRRIYIAQLIKSQTPYPARGSDEAKQIADGKRAHDQLVLANLRLVVSIARRYRSSGLDLADIIQEGTIGLMRAADKFDHTLGYKFSTYATWWVRQAIQRGIADKGRLIRLPVYVTEKLQRITSTQSSLRASLDREPTMEEVAAELGMEAAEIRAILDIARDPVSIDAPIGDDGDTDRGELLNLYSADVAEEVIRSLTRGQVRIVLDALSEQQAVMGKGATAHAVDMLKMRYGVDDDYERTLEEIGAVYGITRERVRQIVKKILDSTDLKTTLAPLTELD